MSFNENFENGIVILGAGNVATHLSIALTNAGFKIKCIYSKTITAAKTLALQVDSHYTNEITQIPVEADLYIIAVKDEIINEIVKNIQLKYGIIVHTAGSIPMDVFKGQFENYGVFYPLQTFSKSRNIDYSNIPICIESNTQILEEKLVKLAKRLSRSVHIVDSEKRKILHLAAVFACNFSNHMFSIATEIMNQSGIPFDLLKPLIAETAQKAIDTDPEKAQTGPAVRNDQNVIQNHLEMLKDNVEFEKIYRFVSESIYKMNQKKNK
ncbi:MAG TPA: DUF2520 domain-containing protein [Bacteroidales bacterium]|jgi:predicted short-subunit dehydrogenase-like oxidoreductase (DUF2520 family)|nr:DUF2520 domain-containing protein [Bacteroidales bacterium]